MDASELLKRYAAGERDFCGVDLSATKRRGARLIDANLSGVNLSGATLRRADFSGTDLNGANLSGADLTRADFTGTDLSGADLRRADLCGADFCGADHEPYHSANLNGAILSGANLSGAILSGTYLIKANLSKANLSGANCSGAELFKANLENANLENANLGSAYLENANLSKANLTNAKLMRAKLENTNFFKAILNGALFWDVFDESSFNTWRYHPSFVYLHCLNSPGIDLREASFNEDTKFPPDFNPLAKGACFVGLTTCFFEKELLMDVSDLPPFLWDTEDSLPPVCDSEFESTETIECVSKSLEKEEKFNPEIVEDSREIIQRAIVQRRGQPQFRQDLLNAYNNKCAITGFDAEQSLEAAHIYPYKGDDTNKVENGLLLRADIHTLFDLYLIAVEPETKVVIIAPELMKTQYKKLNRKILNLPKNLRQQPSLDALRWHYSQCDWIKQT